MISPVCRTLLTTVKNFAAAVKKRGITDAKKVITTPLTVGYFDGKGWPEPRCPVAQSHQLS